MHRQGCHLNGVRDAAQTHVHALIDDFGRRYGLRNPVFASILALPISPRPSKLQIPNRAGRKRHGILRLRLAYKCVCLHRLIFAAVHVVANDQALVLLTAGINF